MLLIDRLTTDMKTAMKAGEKDRLTVIRMLISEVRNIDLQPSKPTAEQAVEGYLKKLKKSQEEFEKVGRGAEVAKLQEEAAIVEAYLPKKLPAAETEALVTKFISANAFTAKDAGRATGQFMKQHGAGVDGLSVDAGVASGMIRTALAGK